MIEGSEFINEVVKAFIGKVVEKTFDVFSGKIHSKVKVNLEDQGEVFKQHLIYQSNELYNWSRSIEFIGLGKPIYTDLTVDLKYYYSSIGYSRSINHGELLSEDDLINSKDNIFLLGDPGSGKTTTLKRIIINQFFTDDYDNLPFSFPLLIRFRAIGTNRDLYTYIADILGFNYQSKTEIYEFRVETEINEEVEMKTAKGIVKKIVPRIEVTFEKRERIVRYIGEVKLELFIIQLIEENRILLIMDGFDEINPAISHILEQQIKDLTLKLFYSKLILTSRPNYIKNILSGCRILYIQELTTVQIEAITRLWLSDFDHFIKELDDKPYKELTNRPLFLCFLILLYSEGYLGTKKQLPKFSKDVYHNILELLIIKWDTGREIPRFSIYGLYFDQRKKLDFLAHLAYELTYVIKKKVFSHETLKTAYVDIYELFDLPKDEAEMVAEELENHTGIIIKSLYDQYEFSHLALQEYLCAKYIVSAKVTPNFTELLLINPVPFALVVCLSSDPVSWFSDVIDNICKLNGFEIRSTTAKIILSRLLSESPNFKTESKLGVAFLKLSTATGCVDKDFIYVFESLIKANNSVLNSIRTAFNLYHVNGEISEINGTITYSRQETSLNSAQPFTVVIPISTDILLWKDIQV